MFHVFFVMLEKTISDPSVRLAKGPEKKKEESKWEYLIHLLKIETGSKHKIESRNKHCGQYFYRKEGRVPYWSPHNSFVYSLLLIFLHT